MLKKVALIVALLAIVPMANAGVTGSIALNSGVVTASGTVDGGTYLAILVSPGGELSNFALGSTVLSKLELSSYQYEAQDLNSGQFAADLTGKWYAFVSNTLSNFPLTGTLLTADFALKGSSATISMWQLDEMGAGVPEQIGQSIVVTPEPATMALLGLGGLFLRRKKA